MDKQMQELLDHFAKLGPLPIEEQTPERARQLPELRDAVLDVLQDHAAKRLLKGVTIPMEKVENILIPSKNGEILARVYHPNLEVDLPIILYFHGGGFVIANLNSYDSSCRALAQESQCVLVSIAYRQAPEHPYPAAHEDAFASYEWLLKNAERLGGNSSQIVIMGESAGGNLATSTCIQAIKKGLPMPIQQTLIYPVVDWDTERPSYKEHAHAKPLNRAMMPWFLNHYFGKDMPKNDPIAFPMHAAHLRGLPPTTVITAEIDPLCDEGEAYAKKLEESGVLVFYKKYQGVTHEFFGLGAVVDKANDAVRDVVAQIKLSLPYNENSINTYTGDQSDLRPFL